MRRRRWPAVPAVTERGGRGARRRSVQGGHAASGRAAMASKLAQGRGVKPAAARPEPKGEKLGELEWVARKLTAQSIWTEDGRREKLDERAELRRGAAMAPDGREADSARERVKRARDG